MSYTFNPFTGNLDYFESGVATTRNINTTSPLAGGGDLSADRTLTTSMSTNKLIGRGTAGTGVMEEITLGTNLSFTGTTLNAAGGGGSMAIGGAVTSGTSGSALYIDGSGNLAQDNANFFWDATNHRLGIGVTSPTARLSVASVTGAPTILANLDQSAGCCSATVLNINTQTSYGGRFINMQIGGVDVLYIGMFDEGGGNLAPGFISPILNSSVDFGNPNGSLRVLPYNDGFTYFEATQSNFRFTGLFGAAGVYEMFYFNHNSFGSLSGAASVADIFGNLTVGSYAGVNAAPTNGMIVSGNVGIGTNAPSVQFSVAEKFLVTSAGLNTKYNNIATVGWGLPAIYGTGRSTAQTAAVASVATYTVGAADGSFIVSANANITTFVAGTFNVTVAYTDETNTAQTLKLNFASLTGTLGVALAAAGPFEGIPNHIRCKASTAITIATSGTFTSLTYNVEGCISQIG